MEPDLPARGPCAHEPEAPCRIGRHHRRHRKTGPCPRLVVAKCRAHKQAFTLYPPGFAPYRRQPVALETIEGQRVRTGAKRRHRFAGTVFQAAIDAAAGVAWHREHRGTTHRWWTTQLRHLALAVYLVGVAPELGAKERDEIADVLRVDTLTLHEQAQALRHKTGYQARGLAVCEILDAIPSDRFLADRLLEVGHTTRRWGAMYRWLDDIATVRRQPFRSPAGSPRPRHPP